MDTNSQKKVKLREISSLRYGFTAKSSPDIDGIPLLRITDIQENVVNWNAVPNCKISDEDIEKYKLEDGDILFARTGATTGKSYLIHQAPQAVFASYLIKLSADKDKFIPEFLIHYFRSRSYWETINQGISGAAQGGFNASKLGNLEIPDLAIDGQLKIVSELNSILEKSKNLELIYQKKIGNLVALKSSILNQAFSGELTKDAA